MKITGLKTFVCNAYRTNWVFVKVLTNEPGLHGIGEATLEYKEQTVVAACLELPRELVGKDPRDIEALWHSSYRDAAGIASRRLRMPTTMRSSYS